MDAWAVVENGAPLVKIEKPTPEPTGTEVLIAVTHCGVCHSDLHFWEGFYELGGGKRMMLSERGVTLPRAIGHEILGRVAKLGPDAKGVAIGDRRIVYPWDVAKGVIEAAGGPVLAVLDFVNGSATARLAMDVLAKGGKMVQVGVFGGELTLSLIGLIFRASTIMGSNTGNPAELREVARLARDGRLAPIPVTELPRDQANAALLRLRDGQVTGRLVLTADAV